MFIDRKIEKYIVDEGKSILEGLRIIESYKGRIVFILSEKDVLQGVLTNGDFIRWLVSEPAPDLSQPILSIANKKYFLATADSPAEEIEKYLHQVLFVPIIVKEVRLVANAKGGYPEDASHIGNIARNQNAT